MLEFILKHTDYYEILAQREAQKVCVIYVLCMYSLHVHVQVIYVSFKRHSVYIFNG